MKEYSIDTLKEFIGLISDKFDYGYLYRGIGDIERHLLIPSIGRYLKKYEENGWDKTKLLKDESDAFRIFYKENAIDETLTNYWQWLAKAQHSGLATRLLDWTYNPTVALFFAVAKKNNNDSAVYVLDKNSEFLNVREEETIDPLSIQKQKVYLPSHINKRIRAQSGLFTISSDPTVPLKDNVIARIRINKNCTRNLKLMLNKIGVHDKALFPDADGLSRWIRWMKFDSLTH